MKKAFLYLALICLVFSASPAFAQDIQNTLLWRISGKGMPQPSYLFGTIHVQDRRVFNLPDSLYRAMDRTEVFSLEINADSINSDLSAYYTKIFEDLDKPKEQKLKNLLDKKQLDDLQKDLGDENIKAGDLTVRQAYLLKEKLVKPQKKADDMPTFLDAYLYRIAKDKGRQIAGLERLDDQIALLEQIPEGDLDMRQVYKKLHNEKSAIEGLIQRYIAGDLKTIQEWYRMLPEETEDKLLIRRNRKMVHVMDSIMQRHSLLAAVGTAHLPGKAGLIQLLRTEGYTVEPVFYSTYTHAANYKFVSGTGNWIDVVAADEGYSIRMPGVPSQVAAADGLVNMKIFVDLATSDAYYACHLALTINPGDHTRDSMMDAWANNTIERFRSGQLKTKRITTNGVDGKQYTFAGSDGNNYRVEILGRDRDMYLLMSGGKNGVSRNADSFYRSFRLVARPGTAWAKQDFGDEYISVRMPGKPKKKISYDDDSSVQQVNYTATDAVAGATYYVSVNKTMAGYAYTDDSLMLRDIEKRMKKRTGSFSAKEVKLNGYTATDYRLVTKQGSLLMGRLILRGNRIYNIIGETQDNDAGNEQMTSFLSSATLLPFSQPPYAVQGTPDGVFRTTAPAPFFIKAGKQEDATEEEEGAKKMVHYISWDKERLISYDVQAQQLSPYYWSTNDTASVKRWLKNSKSLQDSLTGIKVYKEGKLWAGEAMGIARSTAQLHRIKIVRDGRMLYVLRCKVPAFAADDKSIDAFFNDFTILKADKEDIYRSPAVFFKDLHSADTAVYKKAMRQVNNVSFNKTDLPVLLEEAAKPFVHDTGNYDAANTYIMGKLREFKDDIGVERLAQLYRDLPESRGSAKFSVLGMLGAMKDSVAAFRAIKQLMLARPPKDGLPYMLWSVAGNHPQLLKTFYPDWLQLAKDSLSGGMVCELAARLIDSNVITVASLQPSLPALVADSRVVRARRSASWYARGVPRLLSHYDSREAWDEIVQYQFVQENALRYCAAELLLQHGKTPDAGAMDSLAADRSYRTSLYELVKKQQRTMLFPGRFLSQKYFAESRIYDYTEDEEFDEINLIGERTAMYKGKLGRFFLYEMKYHSGDEEAYLGVVGPYDIKTTNPEIDEAADVTGWDSLPDKKDVNKVFKAFLLHAAVPPPPAEETEE